MTENYLLFSLKNICTFEVRNNIINLSCNALHEYSYQNKGGGFAFAWHSVVSRLTNPARVFLTFKSREK